MRVQLGTLAAVIPAVLGGPGTRVLRPREGRVLTEPA